MSEEQHGVVENAVPAYLVFDTESIVDGRLLARVKYAGETISDEEAVARAQQEARDLSLSGSDFLPVTFHVPVAACVLRVAQDFTLQQMTCLDAPQFRPRKIVEGFWGGLAHYRSRTRPPVRLVTFNGRGFDVPLLELGAFRYGIPLGDHFLGGRKRFEGLHLDLMDWLTNYGAYRLVGGLNLLSKLLGKPGKMDVQGAMVHAMYHQGQAQEINDYCMFDTLDTYFVFLRTRVLTGEIDLPREQELVRLAHAWLEARLAETPALRRYLDNWGDWQPWP